MVKPSGANETEVSEEVSGTTAREGVGYVTPVMKANSGLLKECGVFHSRSIAVVGARLSSMRRCSSASSAAVVGLARVTKVEGRNSIGEVYSR
jgi:hypothetical protein